jgi:tricorn protease
MLPHWEDAAGRLAHLELSPTGKRVLVEARGEIFTIPAEKGDVRNLTRSSGSAERDPAWSPDGRYVSYFSDRSGEYQLVIEQQDGIAPARVITLEHPSHYYTVSWSPDSKKLLYHDTNLRVWVLDVASGKAKVVGEDPWMVPVRTLSPAWSPDSRWVAYSAHLNSLYRAIFVADAETGERHQVTDGLADAVCPVFDTNGKYLWFLASTNYGLASAWLDMTAYEHDETFGLYLAVLKRGEPSPFLPESDEDAGVSGGAAKDEAGAPGAAARTPGAKGRPADAGGGAGEHAPGARPATPVTIDFDGLPSRIVAVPGVPEKPYALLKAAGTGTVFYLEEERGA